MAFNELLVVIPHSGILIPQEIPLNNLSENFTEYTGDIDWYTHWLYDFRDILGNSQIVFPYCSLILESNREPYKLEDSIPLTNRLGKDLYKKGRAPDITLRQSLADKYLLSFHDEISNTIENDNISFMLDGHSTVTSHRVSDNQIELMNYQISAVDHSKTFFSPDIFIETYAEELSIRLPEVKITVNESEFDYVYGHVCGKHSINSLKRQGNRVPSILQVTNQKLYMNDDRTPNREKINYLRIIFAESLAAMIKKVRKN